MNSPSTKETNKERLDTKDAQKRLNDILFGDDGGKMEGDKASDNNEKKTKSDSNGETKDTNESETDTSDSASNSFRDFVNKLFAEDMENATDSSEADAEENSGKSDGEKNNEQKDLSIEEIDAMQKKAIKEAFEHIARGEKLTNVEKGNLGEMLMDQYYISQGYKQIHEPRVTDLAHKSGQGIDGVYEKINPDGTKSYIIADAKVNSSELNKGLADGTDQMSDEWIENRLDKAVGKEKADEIRDAYEDNPESVSKEVYHFSYGDSEDGSSTADVSTVDEAGTQNKDKIVVQIFDKDGNEVQGGDRNDQR